MFYAKFLNFDPITNTSFNKYIGSNDFENHINLTE